eukprot:283792-Pelagomonas_calceolata.AAC.10
MMRAVSPLSGKGASPGNDDDDGHSLSGKETAHHLGVRGVVISFDWRTFAPATCNLQPESPGSHQRCAVRCLDWRPFVSGACNLNHLAVIKGTREVDRQGQGAKGAALA